MPNENTVDMQEAMECDECKTAPDEDFAKAYFASDKNSWTCPNCGARNEWW